MENLKIILINVSILVALVKTFFLKYSNFTIMVTIFFLNFPNEIYSTPWANIKTTPGSMTKWLGMCLLSHANINTACLFGTRLHTFYLKIKLLKKKKYFK